MKKDPKKSAEKDTKTFFKPGETVIHSLTGRKVKIIRACKTRGLSAYIVADKKHTFRVVGFALHRPTKRTR